MTTKKSVVIFILSIILDFVFVNVINEGLNLFAIPFFNQLNWQIIFFIHYLIVIFLSNLLCVILIKPGIRNLPILIIADLIFLALFIVDMYHILNYFFPQPLTY